MSKSLSTILTIFKVVKIIAKVVFILCIVGGVGCLIGLTFLPLLDLILPPSILEAEAIEVAAVPACAVGLIACIGEAIFAYMAERYFGNVLKAGTPFTLDGSKEIFRLGIASIIISFAISVASSIALAIFMLLKMNFEDVSVEASTSISTGLVFLFLSLIFKYGAELRSPENGADANQDTANAAQSNADAE